MKTIIKSNERGFADHGWLKSHHTFSFADYYDPSKMGFSVLRVINEDHIAGGMGFVTHPHRNMEIITYVVEGVLEHKDSMGTQALIKPGEVQRMSAGTGIRHSEYNHLPDQPTHLLQIWILPNQEGLPPSYEQKSFENSLASGELILVASPKGEKGSISLSQDVNLYACKTQTAGEKNFKAPHRNFWLQVISGKVQANDLNLTVGDGAGFEKEDSLNLKWIPGSQFLLFDLP